MTTAQACALWLETKAQLHAIGRSAAVHEIEAADHPELDGWLRGDVKDGLSFALAKMPWPPAESDLLVVHQFVRAIETEMDKRGYRNSPPTPFVQKTAQPQ
ncbi:hypothetical protein [Comamonas thiooxydans]|uniref:hypothetical protein n=1 Tax=Comamonas thiooxydans TaxID=363952 RepID=UPI0011862BFC|nr:hypothetical protein [Comamonas thiooxydans]